MPTIYELILITFSLVLLFLLELLLRYYTPVGKRHWIWLYTFS
jgi:hypothetical protein